MSAPPESTAPRSTGRILHRLFLTLFLRGRSSRGLQKDKAPKSVGSKLALTLAFYALFGLMALAFLGQTVFALSVYLHAMTFVFVGLFVAASSGEVLFNKEEADILLHRPVAPRALLWSKIAVMVQVSLWFAGALNLAGFFVGIGARDGGWLFPLSHAFSTALVALFCTGFVVMTYQLCLRWFGRERLDGLMTTAQVIVAVAAIVGGQLVPQLMGRFGEKLTRLADAWWVALLPPAWFAGFDDALAGQRSGGSWALASFGLVATTAVLGIAFGKLARDYETGLQTLSETVSPRRGTRGRRRWLEVMVNSPPLRWCLRDSVTRAAFLLAAAYLVRDRDVKLRVYPALAPMIVFPAIFLLQDYRRGGHGSGFGIVFSGAYLGLIPLLALNLLQYSQQWQASDIFRSAPIRGPAPFCHGARWAVLCLLTLPGLLVLALFAMVVGGDTWRLALLLPGLVALPIYALVPHLGGKAVLLSLPTEEAKSATRGLTMIGVMLISMALSGLAAWSWSGGWFGWFLLVESIVAAGVYLAMRTSISAAVWRPLE